MHISLLMNEMYYAMMNEDMMYKIAVYKSTVE